MLDLRSKERWGYGSENIERGIELFSYGDQWPGPW